MDIRSNKVRCQIRVYIGQPFDICCRHLNSMDGDKWHRHGIELPRSRWLRGHLVRTSTVLTSRQVANRLHRDFVSHVQQQLMALGPGKSRSDIVVLEAQNG